jgi:hypothetical protein
MINFINFGAFHNKKITKINFVLVPPHSPIVTFKAIKVIGLPHKSMY